MNIDAEVGGSRVEFCGHPFTGTEYVEALFESGAPKWDVLACLYLDKDESAWVLRGRMRLHLDDKVFDSADVKRGFRYVSPVEKTIDDADSAMHDAIHLLAIEWLKGAAEATVRGMLTQEQMLEIMQHEGPPDPQIEPVQSKDVALLMEAANRLNGSHKGTPEQTAQHFEREKWENN